MAGASSFPGGFPNGITIRGVPLTMSNPGEVFWVNSSTTVIAKGGIGGNDGNKGTYKQPFATVDRAVTSCIAGRGDIICCMPAHTEEESSSVPIFTLSKQGVVVVGLGIGLNRPTFTFNDNGAEALISGPDCTIHNVNFEASVPIVGQAVEITSTGARVDNCGFIEVNVGTDEFALLVKTNTQANDCDGLQFTNNTYLNTSTTFTNGLKIRAEIDNLVVQGNRIAAQSLTFSLVNLNTATDVCLHVYIADNDLHLANTSGAMLFDGTDNTCTGLCLRNTIKHADVAGATLVPVGSLIGMIENYVTETADEGGYLLPEAGAFSA
jgi:hypothetical protein